MFWIHQHVFSVLKSRTISLMSVSLEMLQQILFFAHDNERNVLYWGLCQQIFFFFTSFGQTILAFFFEKTSHDGFKDELSKSVLIGLWFLICQRKHTLQKKNSQTKIKQVTKCDQNVDYDVRVSHACHQRDESLPFQADPGSVLYRMLPSLRNYF